MSSAPASKAPHSFKAPTKSVAATQWWAGASRGAITLQYCGDCGAITHPPGPNCTTCLSTDVTHRDASGLGTIYSYTVTTRPMHEEFVADTPYTIVYVKLDEGVTIVSWLRGVKPTPALIDSRVQVAFEKVDDETYLHRFEPLT